MRYTLIRDMRFLESVGISLGRGKATLEEQWGGNQLVLSVGPEHKEAVAASYPDHFHERYGGHQSPGSKGELVFNRGESVRFNRFITVPSERVHEIINNGKVLLSSAEHRSGSLEAALKKFSDFLKGNPHNKSKDRGKKLRGYDISLKDILEYTWRTDEPIGLLGVSTSFIPDSMYDYSKLGRPEEGESYIRVDLEIPAEKVVCVDKRVARYIEGCEIYSSVIPNGFHIRRPDISDYAFVPKQDFEGEATFVFQIPKKYVLSVKEV